MGDYCKVHGRYTGNTCTACDLARANLVNAEIASLRTQLAARTAEVERLRERAAALANAAESTLDHEPGAHDIDDGCREWLQAEVTATRAALAPKEKTDG